MSQEEEQKKAMEFQILSSQLEQFQSQLIKLQQQKQDVENLSSSLKEITNLKKEAEFLSPLSSGVLVKTTLKEPETVMMAVGAGVMVKKPVKEASKSVEAQEKHITLMIAQLQSEIQNLGQVINSLQQELQ